MNRMNGSRLVAGFLAGLFTLSVNAYAVDAQPSGSAPVTPPTTSSQPTPGTKAERREMRRKVREARQKVREDRTKLRQDVKADGKGSPQVQQDRAQLQQDKATLQNAKHQLEQVTK